MVLLTSTPQIISLLTTLPPSSLSKLPATSQPLPQHPSEPISHTTLIRLAQLSQTSLNALLRGTSPYFPPPKEPPPPSAEYLALKASLLAREERRRYAAMLNKNSSQIEDAAAEPGTDEEGDEDNIPVSLPFNILVSVLCCGGAVFYMTRYWHNAGVRVLLSLGVAVLVGVAEVVVYAGYLRKVKEAKRKERGRLEKKEVIAMPPLSTEDEEEIVRRKMAAAEGRVDEKEEVIWGRGVNGGMRRRVRENWEKEQEKLEGNEN